MSRRLEERTKRLRRDWEDAQFPKFDEYGEYVLNKDRAGCIFLDPDHFEFSLSPEIAEYISSLAEVDFSRIFHREFPLCLEDPGECEYPQAWTRISSADNYDRIVIFANVDKNSRYFGKCILCSSETLEWASGIIEAQTAFEALPRRSKRN